MEWNPITDCYLLCSFNFVGLLGKKETKNDLNRSRQAQAPVVGQVAPRMGRLAGMDMAATW